MKYFKVGTTLFLSFLISFLPATKDGVVNSRCSNILLSLFRILVLLACPGFVFAADFYPIYEHQQSIRIYSNEPGGTDTVATWNSCEGSNAQYFIPLTGDVAVDSDNGDIYVVDARIQSVKVYSKEGRFLRQFGENILVLPVRIELYKNRVYVTDPHRDSGFSIAVFSKDGQLINTDAYSISPLFGISRDIAVNENGVYFLLETGSATAELHWMSPDGRFSKALTRPFQNEPFKELFGITTDGTNIYVTGKYCQSGNLKSSVFKLDKNLNILEEWNTWEDWNFKSGITNLFNIDFHPHGLLYIGCSVPEGEYIIIVDSSTGYPTDFLKLADFIPSIFAWEFSAIDKDKSIYGAGGMNDQVEIYRWAHGDDDLVDSDGDGLPDKWEIDGLDINNDGVIDLDLKAMGADPMHKDLFVELDWKEGYEPTQAAIQLIKDAFAMAPTTAGGSPNPDNKPGINLWIDTGNLTDPMAREGRGAEIKTCSDGLDNDKDGMTDEQDTDCLVGNNFGGGNVILEAVDCLKDDFFIARDGAETDIGSCSDTMDNDNDGFYDQEDPDCRKANFNPNRKSVFRYGILGHFPCGDGAGGLGELGGNDFAINNLVQACRKYAAERGFVITDYEDCDRVLAISLMHELGHNLNLKHGGDEDRNFKPNYVSVMNYAYLSGIPQRSGGYIIDYSPPRFPGGRGLAPLPTLVENRLSEKIRIDPNDSYNLFIFTNEKGERVKSRLDQFVNWNGDEDPPFEDDLPPINIDYVKVYNENDSNKSELTGHDDWTNIVLSVRYFSDSDYGPVNFPGTDSEITLSPPTLSIVQGE